MCREVDLFGLGGGALVFFLASLFISILISMFSSILCTQGVVRPMEHVVEDWRREYQSVSSSYVSIVRVSFTQASAAPR